MEVNVQEWWMLRCSRAIQSSPVKVIVAELLINAPPLIKIQIQIQIQTQIQMYSKIQIRLQYKTVKVIVAELFN